MSRKARREYIAELESQGLKVKGKQYIDFDLIRRLNMDRFEIVRLLDDFGDIKEVYVDNNGFILMGVMGEYAARVHDPASFGKMRYGDIRFAVDQKTIFEVKPREDAEEI